MKNYKKILPSLAELELVSKKIKNVPNRQGEYLRKVHYGCYLLCSESGLRISEAVKFDLNAKTRKGLYRITKTKGKKERFVYVSREVVKELKKNN
jgi:site-specific recombinase XerD